MMSNATCERLVGTLRRELLDRMLILGERHLRSVLTEYQAHYNTARPHQGIAQRVPDSEHDSGHPTVADLDREWIHRKPVLSGLINEYTRAALHPEDSQVTQANPIFERDRIGIPGAQAQNSVQGLFVSTGSCFYWLHTHAADGVLHIGSPVQRSYTLGEFFDEWGQPLGPDMAGPATGPVVAIYNGQRYEGNPRDIPLNAHAQIQLEVGTPLTAPESVSFPAGL
jgi:hypothetical protein